MPSESPRSSRPRAEDVWVPGDLVPPPGDGAGAAALDELNERLRRNGHAPMYERGPEEDE